MPMRIKQENNIKERSLIMNYLPNYKRPYPDELAISWVCHQADVNCLPLTSFYTNFLGADYKRASSIHLDVRDEFPQLYRRLYNVENMDRLYTETSTFPYEGISMTTGQQTRYVNNVFRPIDGLNRPTHALINEIRACPDCIAEDRNEYGRAYIHRSHNLSGVRVCHKHNRPLSVYAGPKMHECDFNMDDYEEIKSDVPIKDGRAYAVYAHALLSADINTDASAVRNAIERRMEILGYDPKDMASILPDVHKWEHEALWVDYGCDSCIKTKYRKMRNVSMAELQPLLMFLWPEPDDFAEAVNDHEPVLKQYTCPDCGRVYCATPQSQADGWGCPYCMSKVPETERFRQIVEKAGNGEYDLLTDFEAMNKKVKLWHKPCGKIIETTPDLFLFRGTRCTCKKHDPMFWYEQLDFPYPGFQLREYNGYYSDATIHHDGCGQDFLCRYRNFRQSPYCRKCGKKPKSGQSSK